MLLPDYIDTETWAAYETMRKSIRAPLTDFARKRVLQKLAEFHLQGYVADEILAEAVERSWRSVFLWNDAPRRQSTPKEADNVRQINNMMSGALKVAR